MNKFIAYTLYAFLCISPLAPSFAEKSVTSKNTDAASETIDSLGKKIISILESKNSDSEKKKSFTEVFQTYFDLPRIAKHVLKKHWPKDNPDQQKAYVELFQKDIVNTYFTLLNSYYKGEDFYVSHSEAAKDNPNAFMVLSNIKRKNGQQIVIKWRMRDGKILDAIVENVSTAKGKSDEYRKLWRDGGGTFEGFLENLKKKVG